MDWKGRTVTVMGLGLNTGGLGVVRYLLERGAKLIVTDMKSAEILEPTTLEIAQLPGSDDIEYVLGEHRYQDFEGVDCVIKNPGVPDSSPYLEHARSNQVEVKTDLDLFFEEVSAMEKRPVVIGVTGTRGKTTTTMLIAHILRAEFGEESVLVGGNVRSSVLNLVEKLTPDSKVVLELSSFQLGPIHTSPDIAVFTSFFPDHLNRYDSLDAYFADKTNILNYQDSRGVAVLNGMQPEIRNLATNAAGEVVLFGTDCSMNRVCVDGGTSIMDNGQVVADVTDLQISGDHNVINALAAIGAARAAGVSQGGISGALRSFPGVPGRQERIGTINGVEIINDTTSTMPEALYTALQTFRDRRVHLICGGNNKELNYTGAAVHLHEGVEGIYLLPGTASQDLKQEFCSGPILCEEVSSVDAALEAALDHAKEGDVILFSPGATSFGQFQNEFERGDAFVAAAKSQGLTI